MLGRTRAALQGDSGMDKSLVDYWWVPVVRGGAAIALGVLSFVWPGISVLIFLTLIAAYWIVDGGASILYAFKWKSWGWALWGGVISVVAGVLAILQPGVAAISLVIVIAIWAIVRGLLDIYTAVALRKQIDFEWWLGLGGLASVVFGLVVLARPAAGAIAIIAILGAFMIVIGGALLFAGLRIRRLRNQGTRFAVRR